MLLILCCVIAYLLGSMPFSYIIGKRVRGIDLRDYGSGNLGATNVWRTLGPGWGGLCLLLDMAKGAAAVVLMTILVNAWPDGEPTPLHFPPDLYRVIAAFLAAIGHTFSPFVDFHGGKGVATSAGAFVVLEPFPILIALVVFVVVLWASRIVSLASLSAAAIFPVAVIFFEYQSPNSLSITLIVFSAAVSLWVIFKHRGNIRRLSQGIEAPFFDDNKPDEQDHNGDGEDH
jgi:glycerol-3-phosphate acyltransferase PlsY